MNQPSDEPIEFSSEEMEFRAQNRERYNSGRIRESYEAAVKFLEAHPGSLLAKIERAVKGGDYSYEASLDADTKQKLLAQAKEGIAEAFHNPQLHRYPADFIRRVRNEYYWFFELHEEQYRLGLEEQAKGAPRPHYPQCVGASAQARKELLQKGDLSEAERWAEISLAAFHEFEKEDPNWHNINFFGAQTLAILGRYDEAMSTFLDMFRKQQGPVNEGEVEAFRKRLAEIQKARDSAKIKSPYDLASLDLAKEAERLERQNESMAALAEAEIPPIASDARILEVGSGQGFWAKRFARKVPAGTVVCLDHSESLLAIARASLDREGIKNAEYVVQDVTTLSLPRESFDLIHSRMTLSHVAQIEQVMEHLDAVLKPGGKFVVFEPVVRPSQAPYYAPPCPAIEKLFVSFQEAIHRRGSNYTNALAMARWLKAHNYNVELKMLAQTLWDDEVERLINEVVVGALGAARDVISNEEFNELHARVQVEIKARPLLMLWATSSVLIAKKPD